ncbi:MAG: right-handed parallel beta-helix repeat-containing protein [Kiritimatiellae bacterium]|nr:right-handed parallel beta-helix repeat-containing protein [Kiritimatiellia bacterium]
MRTLSIAVGLIGVLPAVCNSLAGDGRREISQADFTPGYTISEPGSYVFTENVDYTNEGGFAALTVNANDVTIDLNGFTYRRTSANQYTYGIYQPDTYTNLTVRNGTLRRWGTTSYYAIGAFGYGNLIERMTLTECYNGIKAGRTCVVRACRLYGIESDGISIDANSVATGNVLTDGGRYAVYVAGEECVVKDNSALGSWSAGLNMAAEATNSLVVANVVSGSGIAVQTTNWFGPEWRAVGEVWTNNPWLNITRY